MARVKAAIVIKSPCSINKRWYERDKRHQERQKARYLRKTKALKEAGTSKREE